MTSIVLADSAETQDLIDRAAAGSPDALSALIQRHLPRIRQAVGRRLSPSLRPRLDESDVVQETQREALVRFDDYCRRRPMPFRLWLLRTAHERIVDIEREHLHAAKRDLARELPLPDNSSVELAGRFLAKAPLPENEAMRKELAAQIRRCLAELPENDREIIMLRCFEGLKNQEVAAMLELSPETTKKRFTRALLRMQSALRRAGIEGVQP